jgi:hypothetical protein
MSYLQGTAIPQTYEVTNFLTLIASHLTPEAVFNRISTILFVHVRSKTAWFEVVAVKQFNAFSKYTKYSRAYMHISESFSANSH